LVDLAAAGPSDRLSRPGPVSELFAARCFAVAAPEVCLQTCAKWVRRRVQAGFEVSSNWVCFSSGFGTLPIEADAYRYEMIVKTASNIAYKNSTCEGVAKNVRSMLNNNF